MNEANVSDPYEVMSNAMQDVWNQVKNRIREKIADHNFSLWIEPLEYIALRDHEIILGCPTGFFKQWVGRHYINLIEAELEKACGKTFHVTLNLCEGQNGKGHCMPEEEQLVLPHVTERQHMLSPLHIDFTFVAGVCGRLPPRSCFFVIKNGPGQESSVPGGRKPHFEEEFGHPGLLYHCGRIH
jgi:hypothetical protein